MTRALLFAGCAAVSTLACSREEAPARIVQPDGARVLADMDRATVPWFIVTDETCAGVESGYVSSYRAGGFSGRCVGMTGGPCTEWGAALVFSPNGGSPAQLSRFGGVRLVLRGSVAGGLVRFQCQDRTSLPELGTCAETAGECFDGAGSDVPLSLAWHTVNLAWRDLTRRGFGPPAPFDPDTVVQCELAVPPGVPFEVEVDEVAWLPKVGSTAAARPPEASELPADYDACVQGVAYYCGCAALGGSSCPEGQILELQRLCEAPEDARREGLLCMNLGEPGNLGGCLEALDVCFAGGSP